ncbi:hypothetical protein K7J31_002874 [Vibrio parahaemolyticus]|nr:hypothetical protein [Vibrio parahaemolyticus]
MFRKITLLIFIGFLSGCNLEQPNDDDCVDLNSSLNSIEKKSFGEHFTICKSLDKNVEIVNVFEDVDKAIEPIMTENKFINSDQVASKMTAIKNTQETAYVNNQIVKDIFGFFKEQVELFLIFSVVLLGGSLLYIQINKKNPSAIFLNAARVISINSALFSMFVLVTSNQLVYNKYLILTGNGLAKNDMAKSISSFESVKRVNERSFEDYAYLMVESFIHTQTCNNNSRNTLLQEMNHTNNVFSNSKDIVEFYHLKDDVYFPRVEEKQNRGVKYHFNDRTQYPTLSGIQTDCGLMNYKVSSYSNDLAAIMNQVDFSNSVYSAIVANDFSKGWTEIKTKFDGLNPIADEHTRNRKVQVLKAYTEEYVKGIFAGAVLFDQKTGEPIKKDTSNLNKWQSYANRAYLNIQKAACVDDVSMLRATNKTFVERKSISNFDMKTYYHCMNLSIDEPQPISLKSYIPASNNADDAERLNNTIIRDVDRETIKGSEITKSFRQDLAKEYKKAYSAYVVELEKIYDLRERLIRLYNCGKRCYKEFTDIVQGDESELKHLYNISSFSQSFDYKAALPNYNRTVDHEIDRGSDLYDIDLVSRFISKEDVDLDNVNKLRSINGTIGTELLAQEYFIKSNIENKSRNDNFIDKMGETFTKPKEMFCITSDLSDASRKDCIELMHEKGGKKAYNAAQNHFLESGVEMALAGAATRYTSAMAAVAAEKKLKKYLDSEKDKGKHSYGKKPSRKKTLAAKVALTTANKAESLGKVVIYSGFTMTIFSLFMEIPDFMINAMIIVSDVSVAFISRFLVYIIAFAFVMVLVKTILGGFFGGNVKKYGSSIFLILISPFLMQVISTAAIMMVLHFVDYFINNVAGIIDVTMFDSATSDGSAMSVFLNVLFAIKNNIKALILLALVVFAAIKITSIAKALDQNDHISVFRTRVDDAQAQVSFFSKMTFLALSRAKQVSGLDQDANAMRERAKAAKLAKRNKSSVKVEQTGKNE